MLIRIVVGVDGYEIFPKSFAITLFISHCNYDTSVFYPQLDCELLKCRVSSYSSLYPPAPSVVPDPE